MPIDKLYFSEYIYIKEFRVCVLLGTEVLHMDKNCKQQDINYIVELLQKECPEKVREVLVFIRSYLGD